MNEIMEIRKQVRLSQWSEMVREREESGLSIREFCAGKSISPKTYYYRLRKLREAAIEASTPEIVQVDPSRSAPVKLSSEPTLRRLRSPEMPIPKPSERRCPF